MKSPSHPNVVFIVGDNVGWGDIGCYGGLAPTPRIDALADKGLRFKNYKVEALLLGPYRILADTARAAPAPTSRNGEQVGA